MADQRRTSTSIFTYLVVVFLSTFPYCCGAPQVYSATGVPVLDLSQPPFTHNMDPDVFGTPTVTPDPLEYLVRPNDLGEAVYAGRFAKELRRLENQDNDIFTNFITDGFVSDEVPRYLPKFLQSLSRKSPQTGFFEQPRGLYTRAGVRKNVNRGQHSNAVPAVRVGVSASPATTVGGSTPTVTTLRGPSAAPPATTFRASSSIPPATATVEFSSSPPTVTTLLPIEKGRLVTKTTTTDFGSLSPHHSSRTGRIHENKFRFPHHSDDKFRFPSLSQIFQTQNTHFTF